MIESGITATLCTGFVMATSFVIVTMTKKTRKGEPRPVSKRRMQRLTILEPEEKPYVRLVRAKGTNGGWSWQRNYDEKKENS
jgi:hypothetical protein